MKDGIIKSQLYLILVSSKMSGFESGFIYVVKIIHFIEHQYNTIFKTYTPNYVLFIGYFENIILSALAFFVIIILIKVKNVPRFSRTR